MSNIEKIKQLKELLDSGALTQEEFDIEKNKILGKKNTSSNKIFQPSYLFIVFILIGVIGFTIYSQNETTVEDSSIELFETTTTEITTNSSSTSVAVEADSFVVDSLDDAKKAVLKINTVSDIVEISERLSVESLNVKGTGSGFLVSDDGYIVTNFHVIAGATNISVYSPFYNKTVKASLVGYSECDDIAVLKITKNAFEESNYYFNWASEKIKLSDEILNLSFPLGNKETTYLEGNISKERSDGNQAWTAVENAFEHTAEILPGSSGSPILNTNFNIVGVAYAGNSFKQEFAIEGVYAKEIIESLIKKENRVNFGFVLEQYEGIGAYISSLSDGGIGWNAGLRAGDIITQIGPYDLSQESTLYTYCKVLRTFSTNDEIDIEWYRISDTYDYKSTLNGPVVVNAIPLNAIQYSKSEIDNYFSLLSGETLKIFNGEVIITYNGDFSNTQINTLKAAVNKVNENISLAQFLVIKLSENSNDYGRIHFEFTNSVEKMQKVDDDFFLSNKKNESFYLTGCNWSSTTGICSRATNRTLYKYGTTYITLFGMRPGSEWFGEYGKSFIGERTDYDEVATQCMQNDMIQNFIDSITLRVFNFKSYEESKSILFRKYCNGEGSNFVSNYDAKMLQIHFDPRNVKTRPTLQDLYNQFNISS
tara:strand:+ start:263 stop:2215 length:1953 start_codon:yes stop_codon:yes gene_type:complete